jgi:hypothetical protein
LNFLVWSVLNTIVYPAEYKCLKVWIIVGNFHFQSVRDKGIGWFIIFGIIRVLSTSKIAYFIFGFELIFPIIK